MRQSVFKAIIFCGLLFSIGNSYARSLSNDPWKELASIVEAYVPANGISYKGTMQLIDDNGDKEKIIETQKFEYTLKNGDYQYRIGDIEMVSSQRWKIAINHSDKTMAVAYRKHPGAEDPAFDIKSFIHVMQDKQARIRIEKLGDENILSIDSISDPRIQGYQIYYSPESYRVHRMVIGMARLTPLDESANAPAEKLGYYYYLDVRFTGANNLHDGGSEFHPEKKYIRVANNRIYLAQAYNNYELSIQTER